MSIWHKSLEILEALKTFGVYDKVIVDREKHLVHMTNGSQEYLLGTLFGCKINMKVYYIGNPETKDHCEKCGCNEFLCGHNARE